jgi:hypothetical protein
MDNQKERRELFLAQRRHALLLRQEARRLLQRHGPAWLERHIRQIHAASQWWENYKAKRGMS